MSSILLENISVFGVNLYDQKRKIWNIFSKNKPKPIKILENLNFSAKNGDRIGIIGKNGQGKSSLVKVITGIYPPQIGRVEINGKISCVLEGGAAISQMVPAEYAIKMAMVYDNAVLDATSERIDEILDFAGLKDYRFLSPIQYSSGMRAKLSVATSLFQSGSIVILDEFSAMIDKVFTQKAMKKLDEIWKNADIGIYVSHNLEEIRKLCTKVIIIHEGTIFASGNVEEMIELYNTL